MSPLMFWFLVSIGNVTAVVLNTPYALDTNAVWWEQLFYAVVVGMSATTAVLSLHKMIKLN